MYLDIYERLAHGGKVTSAVILNGPHTGVRCIVSEDGTVVCQDISVDWTPYVSRILKAEETGIVHADGLDILVELFLDNPRLVILGGGHISVPLAQCGKMLGFYVTVMDDRQEFLSESRFPGADERICGRFREISDRLPVYENAYYVAVTRGHAGDAECVRQILKRPHRYLGMIGSRRKVALIWEMLLKEGYTREQLDSVYAPVGLPIGSQTPEEIAVSILAQIIQVKNTRSCVFSDPEVAKGVRRGCPGVMMTLIKKSGSSPRGIGSKMFLDENGRAYGSIGGGGVEYAAMGHASQVERAETRSYSLAGKEAAGEGMICGGNVEVLFERIF